MGYFDQVGGKIGRSLEKGLGKNFSREYLGTGKTTSAIENKGKQVETANRPYVDEYNKAAYGNVEGIPKLGEYKSFLDASTTLSFNPLTDKLDTSGVDAVKSRALQQGDSPWAMMARDKQGIEQKGLMGSATNLAATQAAEQRAAMSARGGLRGGAAMRLSGQAGQQGALARQGVLQQGALQRADIGLQDQQMKDNFLSMLPGAQLGVAQYQTGLDQTNSLRQAETDRFNIGNTMADRQGKSTWDQLDYQEKMKARAAEKTANAIAKSGGGGGGFLGIGG